MNVSFNSYKQESNCTNMNLNLSRNRQRRLERCRKENLRDGWKMVLEHSEYLKRFTIASMKNKSFNADNWVNDLESMNMSFKKSLKSVGISVKDCESYMQSWNITVNTLKKVHKYRSYRLNDINEHPVNDSLKAAPKKKKRKKHTKQRAQRLQPNYEVNTPTTTSTMKQKKQNKPWRDYIVGGNTISSTSLSKSVDTLNILELTARKHLIKEY